MKYIFMTGAPGSKWSSVSKNIYYSPDIDRTDYSDARTYYHDASGTTQLMHMGAYFDPGMEFGGFFDQIDRYTREQCEAEFNRPFTGTGVRIIKSHVFAHNIDFLKDHWPDCPIILVQRPDDACLGWWVKCGHFGITYPLYDQYYQDLRTMSQIIPVQNRAIQAAVWRYKGYVVNSNRELAKALNIQPPPAEYKQNYGVDDIRVTVI
jgi:hypothetical protein